MSHPQHTFYNPISPSGSITKLLATRNQRIDAIDIRTPHTMPVLVLVKDVVVAIYNCSRYQPAMLDVETLPDNRQLLLQAGDVLEIRAPDGQTGMCLGTIDYSIV